MFQHAYLQETGNGKIGHEETLLRSECLCRGIPVTLFTVKRIQRRQIPLHPGHFIAGDGDVMSSVLKQLNVDPRTLADYPNCLQSFLHRHVWQSTLGQMTHRIVEGSEPVFMKPSERRKIFTGRVFETGDDLYSLGSISRHESVWCSEPVEWLSEFRVYICRDNILSVDCYGGDNSITPDLEIVSDAVQNFRKSGTAPRGYALDFGVLSTGETALVEANDAFSLGAYKISASDYTDLLFERWQELLSGHAPPP